MSDTDPEIEILETDAPPRPRGTPPEFRELVALALKTTDADVLDAAERDYRGTYPNAERYVRDQLAEHLPPYMHWLLACCDQTNLRAGYENGALRIWTISLPDGRVLLFESQDRSRRPR